MDEIKDSREKTIKDSGERTVFESGAVRDMHEGKGRFDLTPLEELNAVFKKYNTKFRPNMNEITDPNVMINNVYHHLAIIQSMIAGKKYVKGALIANLAEEAAMYMMRYLILAKEYTNIYDIAIGVSKHYENGAKKYGEDNWRKGIALTSYLDSSTRHFTKHLAGHDDEPHDIAAIWNMLGLAWTAVNIYNENKNANEEKDEEPTEEIEEIKDEVVNKHDEKYSFYFKLVNTLLFSYNLKAEYISLSSPDNYWIDNEVKSSLDPLVSVTDNNNLCTVGISIPRDIIGSTGDTVKFILEAYIKKFVFTTVYSAAPDSFKKKDSDNKLNTIIKWDLTYYREYMFTINFIYGDKEFPEETISYSFINGYKPEYNKIAELIGKAVKNIYKSLDDQSKEDKVNSEDSDDEVSDGLDTTRDLYYQYIIESLNSELSKYDLGIYYLGIDKEADGANVHIHSNSLKDSNIVTRRIHGILLNDTAHEPLPKITERILHRYIDDTIHSVLVKSIEKLEEENLDNIGKIRQLVIVPKFTYLEDAASANNSYVAEINLSFKDRIDYDAENDECISSINIPLDNNFTFAEFINIVENKIIEIAKKNYISDDNSEDSEESTKCEEIDYFAEDCNERKNTKDKYYSSVIKPSASELKKYNINLTYNGIDVYKPDLGAIISVKDKDNRFECKFTVPESIIYTEKFDHMCDYKVISENTILYTSKYILINTIENVLNAKLDTAESKYGNLNTVSIKTEYNYPDKNFKVIFIFGNDHNYSKIKLYEFEPEESLISSILDCAESTFEEISYIICW